MLERRENENERQQENVNRQKNTTKTKKEAKGVKTLRKYFERNWKRKKRMRASKGDTGGSDLGSTGAVRSGPQGIMGT